MALSAWFWAILILSVLFSGWWWVRPEGPAWRPGAWGMVVVVLLAILGWAVFHSPVK